MRVPVVSMGAAWVDNVSGNGRCDWPCDVSFSFEEASSICNENDEIYRYAILYI